MTLAVVRARLQQGITWACTRACDRGGESNFHKLRGRRVAAAAAAVVAAAGSGVALGLAGVAPAQARSSGGRVKNVSSHAHASDSPTATDRRGSSCAYSALGVVAGGNVLPLSPQHRQLALNLMHLLDQNHDGELTFRNVIMLTEMTEPHWSGGWRRAKADRLMKLMDADADGVINQSEFLSYIERQYETFEERRHLFAVITALEVLHQFSTAGTRRRTDRQATTIVQQLEIGHIATLVNAVVDLEFFDEDQEQEIFEDAVTQMLQVLDAALPHPYKQMVVAGGDSAVGLPDSVAEPLKLRLEQQLEEALNISCLEEPEQRRLRTAVVEIVVEAMKPNRSLHDVTDAHKSGQLIMNVFIRGSVAMLQSNQRGSVVDTVTANIPIPFIPTFITQKAVEFCLGHIEVIVEQAINNVFHRHLQVQIMMPLMVDDA